MARLFKRSRSPFYQIEYRAANGEVRRESTRFTHVTREGQRAANRLLNAKLAAERSYQQLPLNSAWGQWVVPFLRQHCTGGTLKAYLNRWNILTMFLRRQEIAYPMQLTYNDCQQYIEWRTDDREIAAVSRNTARDDLTTLGLVMNEAVRREFALHNPCSKLRIKTAPRTERKEIPESDVALIRAELASGRWHKWMKVQFEIGYYTGRRISETKIAMKDVDLVNCTYAVRVKGGKFKTKPFPPALLPVFKGIDGEHTHKVGISHSTRQWRLFFDRLNMPYSFHCLRVTFVSRCRRAGLDRWTAMQLCDHASALIHAHYNRFHDADLQSALARVFPVSVAKSRARRQGSSSRGPSGGRYRGTSKACAR